MQRIDAVVFDFDGLILDTELPEYEAWREVYRAHGADLAIEVWGRCVGGGWGIFDPHQHLEECLGRRLDRNALRPGREKRKMELIEAESVRPGVVEKLAEAKAAGLRVGLASSSPRHWIETHLGRLGLLDRFDTLCTADDVVRVKPDPELYLLAARRLNARPERCLAFEDSPNGARAAKAAGLYCVAVPNFVTRQLQFEAVDLTLDSLADMRLAAIEAHLATPQA